MGYTDLVNSPSNVLSKRDDHASEMIKILDALPLTTNYTNKNGDIDTKQIALSFTYSNSMFA